MPELDPQLRAVSLDILQALRAAVATTASTARRPCKAAERPVGKLRAQKQGAPLNLDDPDRLLDLVLAKATSTSRC